MDEREEFEFWFIDSVEDGLAGVTKTTGVQTKHENCYFCGDGWVGYLDIDIFRTQKEAVDSAYDQAIRMIERYTSIRDNLIGFYKNET